MDIIFSVDDGSKLDIKTAGLLEKYGVRGIFYIAPNTMQITKDELNCILKSGHEIGGHTLNHQRLTECSLETAEFEIYKGKQRLEELIGQRITKFCYPRGWFNKDIKQLVKDCNFKEARTTKMGITDITGYDPFEKPVTAHIYPRPEYFEKGIDESIIELFQKAKKENGYFNLMMHSWEIEKFKLWWELEQILKKINESFSPGN